jgi:glycosyltransferase involved in cell wall biosynthesis
MIVSFIITTFNRKELLEVLLNSLYSQNFNREVYECQIIVVVDGSTDGTLEMLQTKFSSVKNSNG